MRPMLDGMALELVQEIDTLERRALAEHKPHGMSGSLLQDMGRRPTRLALWGVAAGPEAQQFVEDLDDRFRAGLPLDFTADIVADATLEKVVIEDLKVQDLAGKPERFAYLLTLREHIKPVEPEPAAALDDDILDDAQGLFDELVSGLDIGPLFATGLEGFVESIGGFLTRLREQRGAPPEDE